MIIKIWKTNCWRSRWWKSPTKNPPPTHTLLGLLLCVISFKLEPRNLGLYNMPPSRRLDKKKFLLSPKFCLRIFIQQQWTEVELQQLYQDMSVRSDTKQLMCLRNGLWTSSSGSWHPPASWVSSFMNGSKAFGLILPLGPHSGSQPLLELLHPRICHPRQWGWWEMHFSSSVSRTAPVS